MKYCIRLHCDNNFATMCLNISDAMGQIYLPIKIIRRYALTSVAYLLAYRGGEPEDITDISAHNWMKKHRVHRGHQQVASDQSVNSSFDADLEQLYYPLG